MLGESLRERFGERPEVPIRHEAIKLLSSETRLQILKHLNARRMTVSELARALELNKSTVHEHLGKLVDGGLLKRDESAEREWVYYELTRTGKYVLQPATARFVLLMGTFVLAGLAGLALLHVALTAGQGLALAADEPFVPAGQAHVWSLEVTRPGLLGLREAAEPSRFYLLDAADAADLQLRGALPAGARPLGEADGLAREGPGRFAFRGALEPGVHYIVATQPGQRPALFPLRAEPVEVAPKQPTLLRGIDPSTVEVEVRFRGEPVRGGLVQALDEEGRELAQAAVLNGRAVLPLDDPADEVVFRFQPAEPGSAFAAAQGRVRVREPHVAFGPAQVPLAAPADVRVVVDDPLLGPRPAAPVQVLTPDGEVVAEAMTDASGVGAIPLQLTEPGEFIVKAGDRQVGTIVAKPGLRLWLSPGPHRAGEPLRARALLLGSEPQGVPGAALYVDGREVGLTDPEGWLPLEFGLGGIYRVEARREGYVPARLDLDVLQPRWLNPPLRVGLGFSAAAPAELPPEEVDRTFAEPQVRLGGTGLVRALLRNPDELPRVVRAELREDGRVVDVQGVEVPAKGAAWATFRYEPTAAGAHEVQVNGLAPQVVQVQPAEGPPVAASLRPSPGPPLPALALVAAAVALLAARRRR